MADPTVPLLAAVVLGIAAVTVIVIGRYVQPMHDSGADSPDPVERVVLRFVYLPVAVVALWYGARVLIASI
jgi:hypothetical protein